MKKYLITILHCLTTSLSLFLKAEMTSKYSLIFSPYSPLFSSLKTIMLIQKESLADFCKYIKGNLYIIWKCEHRETKFSSKDKSN